MGPIKLSVRAQVLGIMSFFILLVGGLSFRSTSKFLATEKISSLREIQSLRIEKASQEVAENLDQLEKELVSIASKWPLPINAINQHWTWIRYRGELVSHSPKFKNSSSLLQNLPSQRSLKTYISFEPNQLGLSISVPVSTDTGIQWIEGRMASGRLFSPLQTLNQGPIQALVLDLNAIKQGGDASMHVLYSSRNTTGSLDSISKHILKRLPGSSKRPSLPSSSEIELDDGLALLSWGTIPLNNTAQGFQVISFASYDAILSAFQRFLLEQGFLVFLILGAGIIAALKFSNLISKPLVALVEASKILQSGNFDINVNIKRSDEIGDLAKAFNKMSRGLKQREEDLALAQNSLNRIQLKTESMKKLSEFTSELSKTLELLELKKIAAKGVAIAFSEKMPEALFFTYNGSSEDFTLSASYPSNESISEQSFPPLAGSKIPGFRVKTAMESGDFEINQNALKIFQPYFQCLELLEASFQAGKGDWKALLIRSSKKIPHGILLFRADNWDHESAKIKTRYQFAIEGSLDNATMHEEIVEVSVRDGLTGLFNVRHFKILFLEEIRKALAKKQNLCFLFFDVDHFKKFNDTHGHPAGDKVLKQVASLMRSYFSNKSDVIARYGGEEFVVLLKNCSGKDGMRRADAFRALIEQDIFEGEETQPLGKLTVSIGVSEYPTHGQTIGDVIQAADDALYEAKKVSRNTVVYADDLHTKSQIILPDNVMKMHTSDSNASEDLTTEDLEDLSIEDLFKKAIGDEE